jgi:hypothetical protein
MRRRKMRSMEALAEDAAQTGGSFERFGDRLRARIGKAGRRACEQSGGSAQRLPRAVPPRPAALP